MAHGYVGIVAADEDLTALGHNATLSVDSRVHYSLRAAGANRLDLRD